MLYLLEMRASTIYAAPTRPFGSAWRSTTRLTS
jgi:hypothetical protein